MKVLLITQVFVPDLAANALLSGSLAKYLTRRGHAVTVLAGPRQDAMDAGSAEGLSNRILVIRPARGAYTKKRGLTGRIGGFLRLYALVARHAFSGKRYDVVLTLTTPPFVYVAALLFRWRKRSRVVLWSLDCYPDVAVASGVIRRGGFLHRVLAALNRRVYPALNAVIALDEDMANRLESSGVRKATVIANWESIESYSAASAAEVEEFRGSLGIGERDLLLLYLGNLGVAHEFETILKAMHQLKAADVPIKCVFVGDGVRRPDAEATARDLGLGNVIFRGFIPKALTRIALGAADLGLITLRESMAGLVTPSKMYGYLAMGVPILYVGPRESEVARVIRTIDCGRAFCKGDERSIAEYLISVAQDARGLKPSGERGRSYFLSHNESSVILPRFERLLESA